MTDALSESSRMARLHNALQEYLLATIGYLKDGSDRNAEGTVSAAERVDKHLRGRGTFAQNAPGVLTKLRERNPAECVRIILLGERNLGTKFKSADLLELRMLTELKEET